jgi:hypothetical protein
MMALLPLRTAQFVTHRDTIEKMASELFDEAPIMKGYVVRIFSKIFRARVAFLERCSLPVHARRVFSHRTQFACY